MKKNVKFLLIGLGIIIAYNILSDLFESNPEPIPDKFLKVETCKIKGHLGDCFEVVHKEYKVQKDYFPKMMIEIKRTMENSLLLDEQINNITGSRDEPGKCYVDFVVEFLDDGGNVIATTNSSSFNQEQIVSLIKNTRPGETGVINFYVENQDEIQYFRVGSIFEMNSSVALDEGLKNIVDEISDIAADKDVDEAFEDASKALDIGIQMIDATNKAIKALNDLENNK